MALLYLDTSALVKYYVPEPGTEWVRRQIDDRLENGEWANAITISQLAFVEVAAAVERRYRAGELDDHQRQAVLSRFARDYRERFALLAVEERVIHRAAMLVSRHPLRAYDAVQLASALVLAEIVRSYGRPQPLFASADSRLCEAARREGLDVVNPERADAEI
ncbi:MAG: type II toxin-antitoxin system VapC family toxin [Thermoflexales bacterium]|nr:type II toxin-antitoxin system VapC family toxin [Thermoflexales bacterium]